MHQHDTPASAGYPPSEELEQGFRRTHEALDELERTQQGVATAVEAGIPRSWADIGRVAVFAEEWARKAQEFAAEAEALRRLVIEMDSTRLGAECAA